MQVEESPGSACELCARTKRHCDRRRPCGRCVRVGKAELCRDQQQPVARRTRVACDRCSKAKKSCDEKRPCARCVKSGHADSCFDRSTLSPVGSVSSRKTSSSNTPKSPSSLAQSTSVGSSRSPSRLHSRRASGLSSASHSSIPARSTFERFSFSDAVAGNSNSNEVDSISTASELASSSAPAFVSTASAIVSTSSFLLSTSSGVLSTGAGLLSTSSSLISTSAVSAFISTTPSIFTSPSVSAVNSSSYSLSTVAPSPSLINVSLSNSLFTNTSFPSSSTTTLSRVFSPAIDSIRERTSDVRRWASSLEPPRKRVRLNSSTENSVSSLSTGYMNDERDIDLDQVYIDSRASSPLSIISVLSPIESMSFEPINNPLKEFITTFHKSLSPFALQEFLLKASFNQLFRVFNVTLHCSDRTAYEKVIEDLMKITVAICTDEKERLTLQNRLQSLLMQHEFSDYKQYKKIEGLTSDFPIPVKLKQKVLAAGFTGDIDNLPLVKRTYQRYADGSVVSMNYFNKSAMVLFEYSGEEFARIADEIQNLLVEQYPVRRKPMFYNFCSESSLQKLLKSQLRTWYDLKSEVPPIEIEVFTKSGKAIPATYIESHDLDISIGLLVFAICFIPKTSD